MSTQFRWGCFLAIACAAIALTSGCVAEKSMVTRPSFQLAIDAYDEGDYTSAFQYFADSAEAGDANAQFRLGRMYEDGEGIPQHYRKAEQWYREAAKQGLDDAQHRLGLMYAEGRGVEQNDNKAVSWYRKAARQGLADAKFSLGLMYFEGRGVERNYTEAGQLFNEAGNKHDFAQVYLGYMHERGLGVSLDDCKAFDLFSKAARYLPLGEYNVGVMHELGKCVPQDNAKAVNSYEKAAKKGLSHAQFSLGDMHRDGRGVELDYDKAREWYDKAAEQDHLEAYSELGIIYLEGRGSVKQDHERASKLFRRAADEVIKARDNLGDMFIDGRAVPLNHKEVDWYEQALTRRGQKLADAQYRRGLIYDYGLDGKQDDAKAVVWYEKAANQKHVEAQYRLGLKYQFGRGVERDDETAVTWYEKAAKQDHAHAQYWLGVKHFAENDYSTSKDWLEEAADEGSVDAKWLLGHMYYAGVGVDQNITKAISLLGEAAAEQGNYVAQFYLGNILYERRDDEQENVAKSVTWLRKAAKQHLSTAQHKLAEVVQDFATEVRDAGESDGARRAALRTIHDTGLVPNLAGQVILLVVLNGEVEFSIEHSEEDVNNTLKSRGIESTEKELADWLVSEHELTVELGLHVLDRHAKFWYESAALQGHPDAQYQLGRMYENRQGVDPYFHKLQGTAMFRRSAHAGAVKWYRIAAEQGHREAQFNLGRMYEDGYGVTRNHVHAHKWYNLAGSLSQSSKQEVVRDDAIQGRDRVAGNLNATELAEAQNLAWEWKQLSGDNSRTDTRATVNPRSQRTGSGFWVSTHGDILTNEHVVKGCEEVRVPVGTAYVIDRDEQFDLALLRAQPKEEQAVAKFRRNPQLRVGDGVIAVGYPMHKDSWVSSEAKVTQGVVSALSGSFDDLRFIQIDAAINRGNSGGPIMDNAGNVIGVAVTTFDAADNVSHAVSLAAVSAFLRDNNVSYETALSNRKRSEAEVAAAGRNVTVLVECAK